MKRQRVLIDLVPIRPGKGGTGGGIWNHAFHLVQELDRSEVAADLDIHVLINPEQRKFFPSFERLRTHHFPGLGGRAVLRVLWIHVALPLVCWWLRACVLHKVATETPLWCPAQRVTTVHDFFGDVMHERGAKRRSPADRYFSWATRICFDRSRAVITVSEAIRKEAMDRFPGTRARIIAIHNGADTSVDRVRNARADSAQRTVLCVSKFMPYKGQREAVEAFDRLLATYPEWIGRARLILHGPINDQSYYNALRSRIAQSHIPDAIEIRGYEPDLSITRIYSGADVTLFLSRYEGFGLPVIESQAMDIPVLCSALPVLREIGGDGAVYVDGNDHDAVAVQLHAMLSDEALRTTMARNGRANVRRFSWRTMAERTAQVYRACCV